jgi:hypothetical protein
MQFEDLQTDDGGAPIMPGYVTPISLRDHCFRKQIVRRADNVVSNNQYTFVKNRRVTLTRLRCVARACQSSLHNASSARLWFDQTG